MNASVRMYSDIWYLHSWSYYFAFIMLTFILLNKNNKKKHVDFKFSAYDAILGQSAPGTFKIERLERQII